MSTAGDGRKLNTATFSLNVIPFRARLASDGSGDGLWQQSWFFGPHELELSVFAQSVMTATIVRDHYIGSSWTAFATLVAVLTRYLPPGAATVIMYMFRDRVRERDR